MFVSVEAEAEASVAVVVPAAADATVAVPEADPAFAAPALAVVDLLDEADEPPDWP